MIKKLKLACDIDGCVCSISDAILRFAERNGIAVDRSKYPWLKEELFKKNPDIYLEGSAVEGASERLNALARSYDVVFLTSRPKEARGQTERWLKQNGMDFPVFFLKGSKGDFAKDHNVDIAIEDSPEHILSYVRAGIPVLRCAQPYNRHLSVPEMIW